MPSQVYRLRIRTALNDNDEIVVTSIRNGTNPYIAAPPSGDGQEVDLLTGAVRTGAYSVEVIDAATGQDPTGTVRIITNKLYDADARMQLLSRASFIEMSTDNGANWVVWQAGYVSNINQIDAIRYSITVSNTRRVEQSQQVFTWDTALERQLFPKRGCLFGGPVIGGFGAANGASLSPDSGGWEFTFQAASQGGVYSLFGPGAIGRFDLVAGYFQPNYERKTTFATEDWNKFWAVMEPFVVYDPPVFIGLGDFGGLTDRDPIYAYPTVRVIITASDGGSWEGTIRGLFTPASAQGYASGLTVQGGERRMFVQFTGSSVDAVGNITPAITPGTTVRVRAVSQKVTPQSPLYIDEHPVDIAHKLYQLIGLYVTPASIAAVRAAIGADTRLACRITEPQTMAEFMQKALFGPFGFAARTTETTVAGNLSPVIEFFLTRELANNPPTLTITDADLVGDAPSSIFDLDEATAVTGFTIKQKNITKWVQPPGTTEQPPADMLVESDVPYQVLTGDTTTYSTRMVQYDLSGMVHQADSFVPNPQAFVLAVANEGFQRFGRGAPSSEVHLLRTSSAAVAKIGELVYINASFYPNKNYRIGEAPSVGARVAQVVRREDRPDRVVLKLVDAGWNNQPTTPPVISIAASTTDPRRVSQFTITNATTLNANGKISVAIEWATGVNPPTGNGTVFVRYNAGQIPTAPIALPAVIPGTKVYVRARSEQPELFPSAWTAWQSVTLQAWPAPVGVNVASITNGSFVVSWGLGSPANITDTIEVYVYPGTSPPATWSAYRVATLPPATTSNTITGLQANTNYFVGVAFFDSVSQTRGPIASPVSAVTTVNTPTGTALSPAGVAVIAGVDDATLPQGVALALWGASGADTTVIERAPNNVYFGIDNPGTYVVLQTLPASATTFVDYLPKDGTKYWYRIKHQRTGQADSAYIPRRYITNYGDADGILAIANGVPASLARPGSAEAVIVPESAYSEAPPFNANLTVKLQWTDTQNRFHYVESRTRYRIKKTWQPWSSWFTSYRNTTTDTVLIDYAIPLNATNIYQIEWRVWGSDNNGNVSYIRSGNVEWPQNYGVNNAIITLQRQGFNAATNKYEVWWRFFYQRGNNTLDEDGDDNTQQVFTTGVVAAKVRNQTGAVATNVVNVATKTADGWKATWDSTATDQWTYEISVNTAMPSTYYLQFQNTDNVDEQFFAPTYAQTFVAPAASSGGSGGDVVGPASSTDNALVRFDGTTGKLIQNSSATLSDTGTLTTATGAFTDLSSTNTITGSISGNAATVTNGVYTTGSYSDPSWITSLGWAKISGTPTTIGGYGITDAITTANIGSQSVAYATNAGTATVAATATYAQTATSADYALNAGAVTGLTPTTIGGSFFTLPNPSAIRFVRIDANNQVSALSAADFRTAIDVPTRSGSDASGTWGISITGSSATASSADYALNAGAVQGLTPTTFGGSLFTYPNPNALGYLRVNADNSISILSAADYRTALDVPTRTGGNASGTWGISITGSAATATNASSADYALNAGAVTGLTPTTIGGSFFTLPNTNAIRFVRIDANNQVSVLSATDYRAAIDVPSRGGADASGTWGINITGSASSATSAAQLAGNPATNVVQGANSTRTNDNNPNDTLPSGFYNQYTGSNVPYTSWWHFINNRHTNPDNYYALQIAGEFWDNSIWYRKVSGSVASINGWHRVLSTANYNEYSPTLTGVGASGTWGINITGSAAIATNASSADYALNAGAVAGLTPTTIGGSFFTLPNPNAIRFVRIDANNQVSALTAADYRTAIDVPTRTGGSASGTWDISITGNAATATSANAVPWSGVSSKPSYLMFYEGFTLDANTMTSNATGFTYSVNAPYTGPIARFSSGGNYDLWFNAPYIGGNDLAYRTRNGDNGTLNPWKYILNTSNYNSYAPTLTGGGASGLWNIAISGNAASADSAASAAYANNSGGLLGLVWMSAGKDIRAQEYYADGWFRNYNSGYGLYNEATANHFYSDGQYWNVAYGGTTGIRLRNGHAGAIMGYLYGQTDGQFGLLHNGGGWSVRIYSGGGSGSLYGTWYADNLVIGSSQVLHAGNYNSYSPTLGGGGASGTWGISISGNAATASNSSTVAGLTPNTIFNNMGQPHSTYATFDNVPNFGAYYVQANGGAPSNGTQYYGFTLGLGSEYALSSYALQIALPRFASWNTPYPYIHMRIREGGTWQAWAKAWAGYADTAGTATTATNASSADYASNSGGLLGHTWISTGKNIRGQDITADGSFKLIDGFTISHPGSGYGQFNNWVRLSDAFGFYSPVNNAHIYPNNATYGSWRIAGSRNGWSGLEFDASNGQVTFMVNPNSAETGFHNNSYGWQFYFSGGTCYVGKNAYGGGTTAVVLDSSNYTNYTVSLGGSNTWNASQYFRANRNTDSSNPPLQAYSDNASGAIMSFHRSGYYAINMGLDSDNVFRIGGWSASQNRLQMDMSGNLTMAGNVTAYSDIRLKANVKRIAGALSKVMRLRGVTFTRTDQEDKDRVHAGVIAQEMELVHPEVVYEDATGTKHVAYGNSIGLLIEAIKELAELMGVET